MSLYGACPFSAHEAISSSRVRGAAIPAGPIVGAVTTGRPQIGHFAYAQYFLRNNRDHQRDTTTQ
jgi:hypothetical protein